MTTQHTRSPWHVDHNVQGDTLIKYTGENGQAFAVAKVYATSGNQEADAKLIAAAPDLLAACEAALRMIEQYPADMRAVGMAGTLRAAIERTE